MIMTTNKEEHLNFSWKKDFLGFFWEKKD